MKEEWTQTLRWILEWQLLEVDPEKVRRFSAGRGVVQGLVGKQASPSGDVFRYSKPVNLVSEERCDMGSFQLKTKIRQAETFRTTDCAAECLETHGRGCCNSQCKIGQKHRALAEFCCHYVLTYGFDPAELRAESLSEMGDAAVQGKRLIEDPEEARDRPLVQYQRFASRTSPTQNIMLRNLTDTKYRENWVFFYYYFKNAK